MVGPLSYTLSTIVSIQLSVRPTQPFNRDGGGRGVGRGRGVAVKSPGSRLHPTDRVSTLSAGLDFVVSAHVALICHSARRGMGLLWWISGGIEDGFEVIV